MKKFCSSANQSAHKHPTKINRPLSCHVMRVEVLCAELPLSRAEGRSSNVCWKRVENGGCVHTVRQNCHRKLKNMTSYNNALVHSTIVLSKTTGKSFTIVLYQPSPRLLFVPVLLGCPKKFGLFLKSSQDAEILVQGMFLDGCRLNTSATKSQERLQFYVTYDEFCISNTWDHMCVCVYVHIHVFSPITCEFIYILYVYIIHTYVWIYIYILYIYVCIHEVCVYIRI